jgi:hypothetical protein
MQSLEYEQIWLAADYHFPGTYSCRIPMTSISSTRAMPAPSPATVRLALVRTGIELFGIDFVQEIMFPIIRSTEMAICPPERVAFSSQRIRIYKAGMDSRQETVQLTDSIAYREFAHAVGSMTVYIKVSKRYDSIFQQLLLGIGYWGQASSLAHCIDIRYNAPKIELCALPLHRIKNMVSVRKFITCITSEFRDQNVLWNDITQPQPRHIGPLKIELYIWPMICIQDQSNSRLLIRKAIPL